MEIGVAGQDFQRVQGLVAEGLKPGLVCAITQHLRMGVPPALDLALRQFPVTVKAVLPVSVIDFTTPTL